MTDESEPVGLTREEASKRLGELFPIYIGIMDRLKILMPTSEEAIRLKAQADSLEARMNWIRDWYSLRVWEEMERDSRLLRASVVELNKTTATLVRSSRILEVLTLFLMGFAALTAGYTALGANSIYGRVFPILTVVLTFTLAYWIWFRMPRFRVQPVKSEKNTVESAQ